MPRRYNLRPVKDSPNSSWRKNQIELTDSDLLQRKLCAHSCSFAVLIMSASAVTSPSPSCRPQVEAGRSNRFMPCQGLSTLRPSKPSTFRHASQTTCPIPLHSSVLQVSYSSYDSCVTSETVISFVQRSPSPISPHLCPLENFVSGPAGIH